MTLEAIWKKAWKASVVFQDKGNELITVETIVPTGEDAKVTAITAEEAYADEPELLREYKDAGYIFKGWKTVTGSTIYEPGSDITVTYYKGEPENTLFYNAVWEKTKSCVVQYHDSWYGTEYGNAFSYNNIPESQEVYAETVANAYNIPNDTTNPPMSSVPDARKNAGEVFLGWSKTEGAKEPDYQPGDPLEVGTDKPLELYAIWAKPEATQYTIYYHGNGKQLRVPGTNQPKEEAINSKPVVGNQSYSDKIRDNLSGYDDGDILLGWSEDPNATEPQYKSGDIITVEYSDNVIQWINDGWRACVEKHLYAVWGSSN